MSQIEIKATIQTNNAVQMAAAIAFVQALASTVETTAEAAEKSEAAREVENKSIDFKKKTAEKKAKQKAEADAKAKAEKEAAEAQESEKESEKEPEEESEEESEEDENAPDISEVRKVLSTKVEDNREKIKTKLTELGAKSVSTLEKKNYAEFLDFLKTL